MNQLILNRLQRYEKKMIGQNFFLFYLAVSNIFSNFAAQNKKHNDKTIETNSETIMASMKALDEPMPSVAISSKVNSRLADVKMPVTH